jgi:hypothetical protein
MPNFPINSAPQVLYDHFISNNNNFYKQFHYLNPRSYKKTSLYEEYNSNHDKYLSEFLFSTLDEVRIRKANDYAEVVLFRGDMEDADYFRRSLLRKEVVGDIDYNKHRDHAAHTAYNYLLGWYFYDNVPAIKKSFSEHTRISFSNDHNPTTDEEMNMFSMSWFYTSLLHDIGYIFEGSLNSLDNESYNDRIRRGATIIYDYFHNRFWFDLGIDSQSGRSVLHKLINMDYGNLTEVKTIASLGDMLMSVGSVKNIVEYANKVSPSIYNPVFNNREDFDVPLDSFELWTMYFDQIKKGGMKDRVKQLKITYKELLYRGYKGEGVRLIDHGIASGLILLQYATHFFKLYFTLNLFDDLIKQIADENHWSLKANKKDIIDRILGHEIKEMYDLKKNEVNIIWSLINSVNEHKIPEHFKYDARFWCSGILRATAAVAFHHVLQDPASFPGYLKDGKFKKLSIKSDPLTYLGILVDILQEWDRYNVIPEGIFGTNLPVQGIDVELSVCKNKICIKYNNMKVAQKVRESLSKSLNQWEAFVQIVD